MVEAMDQTWPMIGSRVKKNPATWRPSEFDGWGAGEGIGTVVDPLWSDEPGRAVIPGGGATEAECVPCCEVQWPYGRAFQRVDELLPATEAEYLASEQSIAAERAARGDDD